MASRTVATIPKQQERRWNRSRLTVVPKPPALPQQSTVHQIAYAMAAGLAVRLAVIPLLYADRLDPWRGHWRFAWEMGMVARSLATGKGFTSPFPPETGPTAWMGPVYPALMAAVFKVLGMFTAASAITLLTLNSIFSVLTCIPVFLIARRTLGRRQARWATWMWALFPYAVYLSAGRIWENALSALLLTTLVWLTLVLENRGTARLWAGYGALWALTALVSPAACALLPALGVWIAWRRSRRQEPWLREAVVGALVFAAVLMPWGIRNAKAFGRVIPLRDNFWMEVRVGNTGDLSDIYVDWAHPGRSPKELELYQAMGETVYLAHVRDVAIGWVLQYPGEFVRLTAKRFVYSWTGFWSTNSVYRKNEPWQFPNAFFCTAVTLLALIGLWRMRRNRSEGIAVYGIPLVLFPMVYYVTHPGIEYRHPIDPLIVILMASTVFAFWERRTMEVKDSSGVRKARREHGEKLTLRGLKPTRK